MIFTRLYHSHISQNHKTNTQFFILFFCIYRGYWLNHRFVCGFVMRRVEFWLFIFKINSSSFSPFKTNLNGTTKFPLFYLFLSINLDFYCDASRVWIIERLLNLKWIVSWSMRKSTTSCRLIRFCFSSVCVLSLLFTRFLAAVTFALTKKKRTERTVTKSGTGSKQIDISLLLFRCIAKWILIDFNLFYRFECDIFESIWKLSRFFFWFCFTFLLFMSNENDRENSDIHRLERPNFNFSFCDAFRHTHTHTPQWTIYK